MSIFGIRYPKLENSEETTVILLQNSNLIPSWEEPDELIDISAINSVKRIRVNGAYSSFEIKVFLSKYVSPIAKFLEIYAWLHADVYFYPHIDGVVSGDGLGKAMQDSSSNKVLFHITEVKPYYIPNTNLIDACIVKLISNKYTDFGKTIQ